MRWYVVMYMFTCIYILCTYVLSVWLVDWLLCCASESGCKRGYICWYFERQRERERESKSTYVLPRKPLIVELMATNTRYDSRRAEGGHPALPPAYAKEATVCVQTASTDKVKLLSQTSSARDTDQ